MDRTVLYVEKTLNGRAGTEFGTLGVSPTPHSPMINYRKKNLPNTKRNARKGTQEKYIDGNHIFSRAFIGKQSSLYKRNALDQHSISSISIQSR